MKSRPPIVVEDDGFRRVIQVGDVFVPQMWVGEEDEGEWYDEYDERGYQIMLDAEDNEHFLYGATQVADVFSDDEEEE